MLTNETNDMAATADTASTPATPETAATSTTATTPDTAAAAAPPDTPATRATNGSTPTPASKPCKPKVSIIVPMYRCAGLVDEFADALLQLPERDIEIICVVDGSPDETLELINQRAKLDSRIRVVAQEHLGAGAARNTGLAHATGEYLMFLDADDEFSPNLVGRLVTVADSHQADMVVCRLCEKDCRTGTEYHRVGFDRARVHTNAVVDPSKMKDPFAVVSESVYGKLWRRSIIVENGLHFSTTPSSNDVLFSHTSLLCSRRVVFILDELYVYRKFYSDSSISSNRNQSSESFLVVYSELFRWLEERGLAKSLLDSYCTRWRWGLRYAVRFGPNQKIVEGCAQVLAQETPWTGMDDAQLKYCAGLDTAITKQRLARLRRKRAASSPEAAKEQGLNWRIRQMEAEISSISGIRELLNTQYGKHISTRDSLIRALANMLRERGMLSSLRQAGKRLRAKTRRSS